MKIQIDEFGFCDLNDIFRQAKLPEHKRPGEWLKRKSTKELIHYVDITIHQVNLPDGRINNLHPSCCHVVNNGMYKGVFANEILALDYAAFVSVELRCEIYQEYLQRHKLAETVNRHMAVKAAAMDKMCDKANKLTITQACAEIYTLTGVAFSPQRLNTLLKEGGYKFRFGHWYNNNGGGWCKGAVEKGYATYKFNIDPAGNKHRVCVLTSRGAQYIAEWLNRHYMSHPLRK